MSAGRKRVREDLVRLSRTIVCSIWEMAGKGLPLNEEQERILDVLRRHDEYRSAWEIGDVLVDSNYTVGGVNPFLHVHLHLIVEKQIRDGEPPEVRKVVKELERKGMPGHDAVHVVARVLLEEMHGIMSEKRPFNRERYLRGLAGLVGGGAD